ncbi:citramalate synthase [Nocardia goodfellowii]
MGYPRVELREEVMREGMQIESVDIPVDVKVELLQAIAQCGLPAVNVGSFVSPRYTPQMADIDEVLKKFEPVPGPRYYCLAMNQRGIDRAAAFPWLDLPGKGGFATMAHLCDTFIRRNANRSQADEIAGWARTIARAVDAGATEARISIGAAWGSNFEGPFSLEQRMTMLRRQYEAWQEAGIEVTGVMFADPMSWCMPHWVEETIAAVRAEWPQVRRIAQHLHDGRGMALPSTYATIRALDETFDVSFDVTAGGVGGCPYCGNGRATGMAATEDVVMMCTAMGIDTGVDLARLIEFVHKLDGVLGRMTPGHVSKGGPLPLSPDQYYDPNLPLVETHEEAQHFRLGGGVVEHQIRPWKEPIPAPRDRSAV